MSFRQSKAQIEEDDLIDILKKAIEIKLVERLVTLDSNFGKISKDLKTVKTFVCKINNKDVEKPGNENNEDKENIKLKEIKKYLKEIIGNSKQEIKKY